MQRLSWQFSSWDFAFQCGSASSILGFHMPCSQNKTKNIEQKQYYNKFNKNFKKIIKCIDTYSEVRLEPKPCRYEVLHWCHVWAINVLQFFNQIEWSKTPLWKRILKINHPPIKNFIFKLLYFKFLGASFLTLLHSGT